jgi:hypothetical protein
MASPLLDEKSPTLENFAKVVRSLERLPHPRCDEGGRPAALA